MCPAYAVVYIYQWRHPHCHIFWRLLAAPRYCSFDCREPEELTYGERCVSVFVRKFSVYAEFETSCKETSGGPVCYSKSNILRSIASNTVKQYSAFTYGVHIKYINLRSAVYYKLEINRLSPDVWVYLPNLNNIIY